jgi:GTP cyclohydrolase I
MSERSSMSETHDQLSETHEQTSETNDHLRSFEHKLEIEAAAELFGGVGVSRPEIEVAISELLTAVGEDPSREGLQRTPERVGRMYDELLAGYRVDPQRMINDAIFDVEYDEMVIVRDIEFYSLCEHHMLPFIGSAHVAYLPSDKVIGLSKIPRVVDLFSRRLQVQERLTRQIADFLDTALHPHGVGVVVEGLHLCSMMRGVKKANARMVTSALVGSFSDNDLTRKEFFNHISRGSPNVSL